jgi:MFS family permease
MRGRVFGTITAIAFVAIPLGMALAGFLVEWAGLRATLAFIAAGYLLTTISLLVIPAFRDMERREMPTTPTVS